MPNSHVTNTFKWIEKQLYPQKNYIDDTRPEVQKGEIVKLVCR